MYIITAILGGALTSLGTWLAMKMLPPPPEKKKSVIPLLAVIVVFGAIGGGVIPMRTDLWSTWMRQLFVMTVLAITAYTDFRSYRISNVCVAALLIGFPVCTVLDWIAMGEVRFELLSGGVIAFTVTFLFLILFRTLSRGGIGYGDIKLVSATAALIGLYGTVFILFTGELAALIFAGVMILAKKLTSKNSVPFAPFCYFGYIITLLLGTF
ncbi:MAG: prepilin peptidase [Eubacteriales bacterium]